MYFRLIKPVKKFHEKSGYLLTIYMYNLNYFCFVNIWKCEHYKLNLSAKTQVQNQNYKPSRKLKHFHFFNMLHNITYLIFLQPKEIRFQPFSYANNV